MQGAHAEPGALANIPYELAAELRLMAEWLELDQVEVRPSGDLSGALQAAVRDHAPP